MGKTFNFQLSTLYKNLSLDNKNKFFCAHLTDFFNFFLYLCRRKEHKECHLTK